MEMTRAMLLIKQLEGLENLGWYPEEAELLDRIVIMESEPVHTADVGKISGRRDCRCIYLSPYPSMPIIIEQFLVIVMYKARHSCRWHNNYYSPLYKCLFLVSHYRNMKGKRTTQYNVVLSLSFWINYVLGMPYIFLCIVIVK
jgi:hypothetical protein